MLNPPHSPPEAADTEKDNVVTAISAWLKDDLQAVNDTIIGNLQSSVPLIPQLAGHLIAAGGKRLRPLLTLLTARLVGYDGDRHIFLAACVEFIHSATLLHDDVVDESDMRRGQESANSLWGNQASVLVGDFLFSRAFQMMVKDGNHAVQTLLADTSAIIAEGEVNQLRLKNAPDSNTDLYMQVINGKTAALFAAAAAVPARLKKDNKVGGSEADYQALYNYGQNLGMVFQLIDDILDYSADQQKLGKTVGDDFAEGKVTLPIILAWQEADSKEKEFLNRTICDLQQQDGDFATMQALLEKYDSLQKTKQFAADYGAKAQQSLQGFAESQARDYLQELVTFCLDRGY